MNEFREHVREADPEYPRMCKMKFKPSSMKDFPISELYDTLGTTKVRNCLNVYYLKFLLVIEINYIF